MSSDLDVPEVIRDLSEVLEHHNVGDVIVMFQVEGGMMTVKSAKNDPLRMLGYLEIIKSELIADYEKNRETHDATH